MSFPNKKEAERISVHLLEKRLAACIQILPMRSFYRWKGKIEKSSEYLCFVKTSEKNLKEIISEVKKFHSYEVPEIISFEITGGYPEYLRWLAAETD
ncbi:MAG: divalent-cation tolerance protein CutA [Candidatus Micrarchaeota archaeon]|nr:divalent-cation tolerance protein CutA [Candidatus Micrarchaeota archaeon]